MIDVNALRAEWVKYGMTQAQVANKLGLNPKTLSLKLKRGVLGSDEIEILIDELSIKNPLEIFFKSE